MMLPKPIDELFTATIPSTGKKIKFRSFNIREEKALLLAKESNDVSMMVEAIKSLIRGCTDGKVDPSSLAMFDIEYLLTQIRAKSVGEIVTLLLPCAADEKHERVRVPIDLTKMNVRKHDTHTLKFDIDGNIGVMMKYPNLDAISQIEKSDEALSIALCIDYIFDQDQVYHSKDTTIEELLAWVQENLKPKHLKEIKSKFFDLTPNFEHSVEYSCPVCGHMNKKVIKGTSSFFV